MGSSEAEDEEEGAATSEADGGGMQGRGGCRGGGWARLKVTDYYVCVFVLLFYFLDNLGLVLFSILFSFK